MQEKIYKELLGIAGKKNIEVIERNFKSSNIKGLYGQYENIEVIALNSNIDDPTERNFTLAHELGHQKLHKETINETLYFNDNSYKDELEKEADNYAYILIDEIIGGLTNGNERTRL